MTPNFMVKFVQIRASIAGLQITFGWGWGFFRRQSLCVTIREILEMGLVPSMLQRKLQLLIEWAKEMLFLTTCKAC